MKDIKESILSELPDDIKTKVLMDLEKQLSGGGVTLLKWKKSSRWCIST